MLPVVYEGSSRSVDSGESPRLSFSTQIRARSYGDSPDARCVDLRLRVDPLQGIVILPLLFVELLVNNAVNRA